MREVIILDDEPGSTSAKRARDPVVITLDDDAPRPKLPRYGESFPAPQPDEHSYYKWCIYALSTDFPRASMGSVRRALRSHGKKLTPAYEVMYEAYRLALQKESSTDTTTGPAEKTGTTDTVEWLKLSRVGRVAERPGWEPCIRFEEEFVAIKRRFPGSQEIKPHGELAVKDIECSCCFTDCSFDELVQCADGHLFCFACVRRHVEEFAFGGGQSRVSLPCMDTSGCTESFPWSEVQRAVPGEVLSKYERRLAEDAVARAKLDGLVYCPFCGVPCEVDGEIEVLDCPNPACRKSSCLKCKELSHSPRRCQTEDAETLLRTQVEELMTKALIRECSACKAELIKLDGCNKVICRCGKMICYVCRQQISGYQHFCTHNANRGSTNCKRCFNKCNLWEKENPDDLVEKARKAAVEEAAIQDPGILNQTIGPDNQLLKTSNKRTVVARKPRGRGL